MHVCKLKPTLLIGAAFAFALTACESSGGARISYVGAPGKQTANDDPTPVYDGDQGGGSGTSIETNSGFGQTGATGPRGEKGDKGDRGARGPQGEQGPAGADGSFNFGDAGALAVGGLVGPGGVANTGLFANTGATDSNPVVLSRVEVGSGRLVNIVAQKSMKVAEIVDAQSPGSMTIAGSVVGVVEATGMTLIATGNGEQFLVDGIAAAPGAFVNATIGEAVVIGDAETTPVISASLLSPDAPTAGDLVTVGIGSGGELVTLAPGTGAPATSGTGSVLDPVTATLPAATLPSEILPAEILPAEIAPTAALPTDVLPAEIASTAALPTDVMPAEIAPDLLDPVLPSPATVVDAPATLPLPTLPQEPVGILGN